MPAALAFFWMSRVADEMPERSMPPHQTRSTIARPRPDPVFFIYASSFFHRLLAWSLPAKLTSSCLPVVLQPRGIDFFGLALVFFGTEPGSAFVRRGSAFLGQLVHVAVLAVLDLEAELLGFLADGKGPRRRASHEHPGSPGENDGRDSESRSRSFHPFSSCSRYCRHRM